MLDFANFKEKYNYDVATPMIQQYLDIKFEHQDALLLYRMGDFYELFFDDAHTASNILGLALAKRGKHGEVDLPMCGVPHHALTSYLHKLVESGNKVAICDQLETPAEAKKRGYKAIVKRGVTRIITQGTITEESILPEHHSNYLASIICKNSLAVISYLDVSTSEFNIVSLGLNQLASEISRIGPSEIIISESAIKDSKIRKILEPYNSKLVIQVESYFATPKAKNIITRYYNILSTDSLGELTDEQIASIGAVLEYVNITQRANIPKLGFPKILNSSKFLEIDQSTRRNLEITSTISGSYKGSLLSNINLTITKMGLRLLYTSLSAPLSDVQAIKLRQDKVESFYSNVSLTSQLRNVLKNISDVERILMRISMKRCIPRDLLSLKDSLKASGQISDLTGSILPAVESNLEELIEETIREDAPNNISSGGIIKKSYNKRIEDLYNIIENSDEYIHKLKLEYQEKTKIDTLKISHNNILGTFIEVTPKNAQYMDDAEFIHKQTLASSVRYTSERLRKIELGRVNAHNEIIELELSIFWEICKKILDHYDELMDLSNKLAELDMFSSLAKLALDNEYIRPEIDQSKDFIVKGGRHVNVENSLPNGEFIPNDCDLAEANRVWLITGPNMAGKSTFLRQNALIVILAQMGSYVPASYAKIGLVDKLFSRIGASDDIAMGRSTFMVEMIETAAILSNSTDRSFIILDEIGRGTSTYDGLSIAWASLEFIHNDVKSRCLFASHYHELTVLSKTETALRNYTVDIREDEEGLVFLHKLVPGVANKSYGIHVAELAGLPKKVIMRSEEVLSSMSKEDAKNKKKIDNIISNNYSLFDIEKQSSATENSAEVVVNKKLMEQLSDVRPDELSPKDALELIYKMKKEIA